MITAALAWLRARWHAFVGAAIALMLAIVWSRRAGRLAERARTTAANRDALGAELRADDALDERDRERAQIEAAERAVIVARAREQLARPTRTTAQAKAEAMQRLDRAARAADEDR